jgi:hypothetical protein
MPKTNIALDFHGLIIDHRPAKYAFFKEVVGVPYSHPLLDRKQILAELRQRGYDLSFYFDAFDRFIHSAYAQLQRPIRGVQNFLNATPSSWEFQIISTAPYNTVASVHAALENLALPRIVDIVTVTDESRVGELERRRVRLYFDDKPDILPSVSARGIATVQISEPGYAEISTSADLGFQSWQEALDKLEEIVYLIEKKSDIRDR